MEDAGRVLAPAEWIALAQRSDGVTEPGPGERLAGEMSRPASSPSEWLFNEHVVDAENLTFELSHGAACWSEPACNCRQANDKPRRLERKVRRARRYVQGLGPNCAPLLVDVVNP